MYRLTASMPSHVPPHGLSAATCTASRLNAATCTAPGDVMLVPQPLQGLNAAASPGPAAAESRAEHAATFHFGSPDP